MTNDLMDAGTTSAFSNPVADIVKNKCPEVETYTRLVLRNIEVEADGDEKLKSDAFFADRDFFRIFSFPLIEGNAAQALEVKQSAVISRSYANRLFPNENPVGKTLRIKGVTITITGVMKDLPQNTLLSNADMVLNYRMLEEYFGNDILENWGNSSFPVFFLAKPGADLPSKAPLLLEDFSKDYWIYTQGFSKELSFVKLQDVYFGNIHIYVSGMKTNSISLVSTYLGIVLLILVVAILNYVNLSISQAMKRGKESAVRKLLGSSHRAVFMQYIMESTLMTFVSLLLGILLAFWLEPFSNEVLNTNLHLAQQFTPGFILVLLGGTVVVGAISGLFPAWVTSRFEPIEVVKGTYSYRVKTVYSKILVTFQYTVAIVLLIYSVFIVRQNDFLLKFDLGYSSENLFVLENRLHGQQYQGFRDKLRGIAGVENLSFANGTPLDGGDNFSFDYNGEPVSSQVFQVDTAFFDVFGIKVQYIGATPSGKSHLLLNRKLYDILQPDSLSHTVYTGKEMGHILVSGVIDNIHFSPLHNTVGPLQIEVRTDDRFNAHSITVKMVAGTDVRNTANQIKAAYADYSGETNFDAKFADEYIQDMYEAEEKNMKIILAFTILTTVILMMGVLSMSLYYVRQHEKEIAVRKVHGSSELEILSMLNSRFILYVAIAFVIAVPVAYFFSVRFMQGFAYNVGLSWWVFALAGIFTALLSIVFVSIQSWRTVIANPVGMLKND
jgi:putative ABC transport system permease protein